MTESFLKLIGVEPHECADTFVGIGRSEGRTSNKTTVEIRSRISNYSSNIDVAIIEHITERLPSSFIDTKNWNVPPSITLADPNFHQPGSIDILLSANIFFEVLQPHKIDLGENKPFLVDSLFGWVVGGSFATSKSVNLSLKKPIGLTVVTLKTLSNLLESFWKIEQFGSNVRLRSEEDEFVERHFSETHSFTNGKFVVRLPFKENPKVLGNSKKRAEASWFSMERKFVHNPELKAQYDKFMEEYLALGHMILAPNPELIRYFLPHHTVI